MRRLSMIFAVLLVAACGTKGPLTLPPKAKPAAAPKPAQPAPEQAPADAAESPSPAGAAAAPSDDSSTTGGTAR